VDLILKRMASSTPFTTCLHFWMKTWQTCQWYRRRCTFLSAACAIFCRSCCGGVLSGLQEATPNLG